MKLAVLAPSIDYMSNAGARIRYERMRPALAGLGIDLFLYDIDSFDAGRESVDAALISKCYDARAKLAAAVLSSRGKLVGIDLFDDYFSQFADSRLSRFRDWLRDMAATSDFALCSTPRMAEIAHSYCGDLPIHVLNDPAPPTSTDDLGALVRKKLETARAEGQVHVAWFGVGSNRYVPLGLNDLATCAPALRDLAANGLRVALTILTDKRSLDGHGLSLISQLPVEPRIEQWSEAGERSLLRNALLCLLPVSAQPFSIAKSLNRAMTALSSGCQVLSTGYPLYAVLDPFIYRDVTSLVSDLKASTLRLSERTADAYGRCVQAIGDPKVEAEELSRFVRSVPASEPEDEVTIAVVHGLGTRAEPHRLVQSLGGLSVASPFCTAPLNFDVIFRSGPTGLIMLVSKRAARRLSDGIRSCLGRRERIRGDSYASLPSLSQDAGALVNAAWQEFPLSFQLAIYERAMRELEVRLVEAFGPTKIIRSETSDLPAEPAVAV